VYLGEQIELGTQAAIKVLNAQLTSVDIERFNAEASTIARLSHPHIVRLLEFATGEGTPFLVLDYAPGGTLRERHPRGTPLPVEAILPYVRQVCEALSYVHEQKLIHRDVKPENLLLSADGNVLLGDFGIATVAQSSHSQSTQEALGTITYMAPEQIQGKPRPASDLYALGVIVYEWLTGEPPFSGPFGEIATQHLFATPQPLRERVPAISEDVAYVVSRALAKDPKERYATAQDFAAALSEAAEGKKPLLFAATQITPPSPANATESAARNFITAYLTHPSSENRRSLHAWISPRVSRA
jgi:serine/threonine protein kinase